MAEANPSDFLELIGECRTFHRMCCILHDIGNFCTCRQFFVVEKAFACEEVVVRVEHESVDIYFVVSGIRRRLQSETKDISYKILSNEMTSYNERGLDFDGDSYSGHWSTIHKAVSCCSSGSLRNGGSVHSRSPSPNTTGKGGITGNGSRR